VPEQVTLQVLPDGRAALTHGEVDLIQAIPGIRAVGVRAMAGEAPTITLDVEGPFYYDGPAEIVVRAASVANGVREFLAAIDPGELESKVLEQFGGFGGPTTGEATLVALTEMLESLGG